MPLDTEQQQKVTQWLEAHKTLRTCTLCGADSWTMHANLLALPTLLGDDEVDLTSAYGAVAVRCDGCAQVLFFSATQIGVAY